ncbi:MAG: SemiSWEET transporter [Methanomicrobiales archaeon]|nr:SemiSWEET transporter [Methanomicrobiales archaeon]MDI6876498.1 SemiSWEET transporter [Methanomicrobiales archaeon]
MDQITALGLIAGFLTTISFLPQVAKTRATRSARDFSYGMLTLFLAGLSLWTWYGVSIQSHPIVIANVVTIGLVGYILGMKLKFG